MLVMMAILVHPALDAVSDTLMMFLMLLVIAVSSMLAANLPIAALAATVPSRGDLAQLCAERQIRQLRAGGIRRRRRRIFCAARPSSALDDARDTGSTR